MTTPRLKRHVLENVQANPHRWYPGCLGKDAYPSRRVAIGKLRALLTKAEKYGTEELYYHIKGIEVYRCGACKKYHHGHPQEKYRRQRELERRDEAIWGQA